MSDQNRSPSMNAFASPPPSPQERTNGTGRLASIALPARQGIGPRPTLPGASSQLEDASLAGGANSQTIYAQPYPAAHWEGSAKVTLFSSRSLLTCFSILSAVVLTLFSSSGIITFQGQFIKWKLLLFTLQLEATLYVFVRDLLTVGVDYLLVSRGMTMSQISHALSITTSLRRVQGATYKAIVIIITTLGSIIAPILLAVVLKREGNEGRNLVAVENMLISTNVIGGRVLDNFGATGQSYLFNISEEKFRIRPGAQHYAVYLKAGTAHQTFVPKTPQIGPYSTDCNSDENVDIVSARVLDVEGLLYKCEPTVDEQPRQITDFEEVGAGTSSDTFRLLSDSHQAIGKDEAKFNVTMAIRKGENSTAILYIPCDVIAATASLDVIMNDDGVMGMSIVNGDISESSMELPPRVLGEEPNALELALENAIGRKGIGIVSRYVATDISDWEGLIRGVTAAYGIRSALQKTFADRDQKKNAVNVRKFPESIEETQRMRVVALWIPVGLALASRIITWLFPSIFNGGLKQVLCWMQLTSDGAGGTFYKESGKEEVKERPKFICLKVQEGNVSCLGLSEKRDNQLGLGSYRWVRRLTNRGLVRGFELSDLDGSGGAAAGPLIAQGTS